MDGISLWSQILSLHCSSMAGAHKLGLLLHHAPLTNSNYLQSQNLISPQNLTPDLTMHRARGFSLNQRRVDEGADLRRFYHGGHRVLMRRKQWENFRVLLVGVVKNGSVVGGCGVVHPKWWWLWIGLDSLVVVGLLLVWVNWCFCVWSLFDQLGSLMIWLGLIGLGFLWGL